MRSHRNIATLLLLMACGSGATPDNNGEASMFRGDAAHHGVYPARLGHALVGVQWRVETDGAVAGSATTRGDTVWVGASDGVIRALALADGATLWQARLGAPISSTPAVAGDQLFVTTRDGRLHALEAANGTVRWTVESGPALSMPWGHESGDRYTPSPTVSGNLVVWGAADGVLRVNDRHSGTERWHARTGGPIWDSPAIADGVAYVGSADGLLYAFDLDTGERHWAFRTEGAGLVSAKYGFDRRTLQSSPAVADGLVLVGARDGFLYAIHVTDGSLAWRFDHQISWVIGSPSVDDSMVYVGSSDAQFLQALDVATGAERWRTKLHGVVWSSPAVTGDLVVVGDGAGHVHAVDRGTGAERWVFGTASQVHASPVPLGRLVVVGSLDGGIYALCTGDTAPDRIVVTDEEPGHVALGSFLTERGYRNVAPGALAATLASAGRDPALTTVVMASYQLPDDVASPPWQDSPLRQFLEAGGKVVWTTMPPLVWPFDSAGRPVGLDGLRWDAPGALLGVSFTGAIFDRRRVAATADGEQWGLRGHWMGGWSVDTGAVTTVLGLDSWGMAAAWVRSYGGPVGTGFVMTSGDDPEQVYQVAEHRPACDTRLIKE